MSHEQLQTLVRGQDHLDRLLIGTSETRATSTDNLRNYAVQTVLLGTSLTALFEAATCHRGCSHGPHVLEAVCARAYNLAASAYLLAMSGFYDESANLVRSIGEIANLVSLSSSDPVFFQDWLTSDPGTRKKRFSPVKVRMALERSGGIQIVDQDWYTRFCEGYTHITPTTKPGMHNDVGRGNAGGVFQADGMRLMLDELANTVVPLAMMVCAFFKFDDLLAELTRNIDTLTP